MKTMSSRGALISQAQAGSADDAMRAGGAAETEGEDLLERFLAELPHLYAFLERIGISAADREDIVHEVFLVFHRRKGDYDRERPLRPWLSGIAYRTALHARKAKRELAVGSPDPIHEGTSTPESEAVANESVWIVREALNRLPIKQRAVFVMHEIDGIDVLDIARSLGIPRFTVYSRLRNARERFTEAVQSVLRKGKPT